MQDKDFNPTKKDLLNLESLILNARTTKNEYVNRKRSLENSLGLIKEKMKGFNIHSKEYKKAKNTLQNIKTHLGGIEIKIKDCNNEINYKNKVKLEVEHHVRNSKVSGNEIVDKIVNELIQLKNKYNDFTKDRTRIASLRIMSSEFVSDLEKVINKI